MAENHSFERIVSSQSTEGPRLEAHQSPTEESACQLGTLMGSGVESQLGGASVSDAFVEVSQQTEAAGGADVTEACLDRPASETVAESQRGPVGGGTEAVQEEEPLEHQASGDVGLTPAGNQRIDEEGNVEAQQCEDGVGSRGGDSRNDPSKSSSEQGGDAGTGIEISGAASGGQEQAGESSSLDALGDAPISASTGAAAGTLNDEPAVALADRQVEHAKEATVSGRNIAARKVWVVFCWLWSFLWKAWVAHKRRVICRDWQELEFAPVELQHERDTVLAAVKQDWKALEFAAPALRSDFEIVNEAVQQNWRALRFASKSLRAHRELVLGAVRRSNGWALEFAAEELYQDGDLVREATTRLGGRLGLPLAPVTTLDDALGAVGEGEVDIAGEGPAALALPIQTTDAITPLRLAPGEELPDLGEAVAPAPEATPRLAAEDNIGEGVPVEAVAEVARSAELAVDPLDEAEAAQAGESVADIEQGEVDVEVDAAEQQPQEHIEAPLPAILTSEDEGLPIARPMSSADAVGVDDRPEGAALAPTGNATLEVGAEPAEATAAAPTPPPPPAPAPEAQGVLEVIGISLSEQMRTESEDVPMAETEEEVAAQEEECSVNAPAASAPVVSFERQDMPEAGAADEAFGA